ncbi:MAG: stage II sporulation protein R [Christensenellales bacterium]|jgi:stage II sporulation protein R
MKKILPLLMLVLLTLIGCANREDTQEAVNHDVLRLHVVANSDSDEDQQVKLAVRDAVLLYMEDIHPADAQQAYGAVANDLDALTRVAQDVLQEQGLAYDAKMEIGQFDFPAKTYQDITYPAGKYDALRVVLGEGKGQNWWCVMFPPLCFLDVTITPEQTEKPEMEGMLDSEITIEYESIFEKWWHEWFG